MSAFDTMLIQPLAQIRKTDKSIAAVMKRIQTGKKVADASDDPATWAQATKMSSRANEMKVRMDAMHMGVNSLKAADNAMTGLENYIKQAKAVADAANSTSDPTERATYQEQFNELRAQIDDFVKTTEFRGVNLLNGEDLNVWVERGDKISAAGMVMDTAGLGVTAADFTNDAGIKASMDQMNAAIGAIRDKRAEFGRTAATLESRADYSKKMISTIEDSVYDMTANNMEEDVALLKSLQVQREIQQNMLKVTIDQMKLVLQLY